MNQHEIISKIEHTYLKPYATPIDIEKLCQEALKYQFYGVCVNSVWIELAATLLAGSKVKIISTAGFPLGTAPTLVKCHEVEYVLSRGAHEIDFVMNIGWLKSGDLHSLAKEFNDLVEAASEKPLKVILETCFLTDQEKKIACQLAVGAGISFVKTSTGFGSSGAALMDIQLLKNAVGKQAQIKASGGIKDAQTALKMIAAGADRIGTSSSVEIFKELQTNVLNQLIL